MANLISALLDFNPWWKEKFELPFKKREVYKDIQRFLPLRQIIALTGLRRVGKTTLLLKVVTDSIARGFPPRRVLYFAFDEFRQVEIRQVLKAYEEIIEEDIKAAPFLLVLDEIQKLGDWESQLKVIYDTSPKVKLLISGSESLFIKKKSQETLAGRIFEFKVEPLSFKEFLFFKGEPFEPIGLYERELSRLFDEFILTWGFPELVGVKEKAVIKKYIRESIVERVVYRDISQLFRIKDISVIESLLNIFMEEPGQVVELSDLAKDLKLTRQTLSNYLTYLEESFLIRKLYNFSRSRRKVERKIKKYYPTVVSPDLLFADDHTQKSRVFECLIVNQLKAEFFWRDPFKNEVDIVRWDKESVPFEVKYGKVELKGLLAFMRKFKIKRGFVISRDKEQTLKTDGQTIRIIPAFKFLLK